MLHIAYAEDDAETATTLKGYLDRYAAENDLSIEAEHFDRAEKLIYHYSHRYDLLLLDIQLGSMSGMEAAEEIRKLDTVVSIIFITSLVQYAVKGYEVDALDFIVKPVGYSRFAMKMDKALRVIGHNRDISLPVPTGMGTKILSSRDIQYIEVSNHNLIYHTGKGTYLARGSLGAVEEKLRESHFLRISVSHLVNLEYITAIDGSTLTLNNGDSVWISRAKKREVMTAIAEYLGGST